MAQTNKLRATARPKVGKGAARAARRAGRVPAVIYGDNQPPVTISVDYKELFKLLNKGGFLSMLTELEIDGDKTRVIPRDVQLDVIRGFPMHVDFLRLGKGARIAVDIPVNFLNEEVCPGLKRGGALNVVRHEIELECPAGAIPDNLEIDLSEMDIGDSLHISEITLPEGATPTITDRDFTIVTIAAPAGGEDEDEEGDEEDEIEFAVPTETEE
jgi:large subunit ribosomal protein L25